MKRYNDYDVFAWLYNRELGWYSNIIFPFLKIIAEDNLRDGSNILDLCCGTGHLAKILCENGYHVTGIDGSAKMLQYARKNAPSARFILSDVRTFKLPSEYDAVFSTFDSLNHILMLTELEQVFENVYKCLKNGGIFIFDMNMQEHFETRMKERFSNTQERPKYLYIMRTEYDEGKKLGRYTITIFQREDKFWRRSDIVLYQTWYPLEVIVSSLEKTGFTSIKAHAFTHQRELQEVNEKSDIVFFYAQKS